MKEKFYMTESLFHNDLNLLKEKLADEEYAVDMYRALCNMRWENKSTGKIYSCSWRYAGGLIADIRDVGENYMDFYCSGNEGHVSESIETDLNNLGWIQHPWERRNE